MQEPRNRSTVVSRMTRAGIGAAIVGGLLLAGCGGGGSSDSDQISTMLQTYYEHPAAGQCKSLTTDHYRSVVYGGSGDGALEACEAHQGSRKTMPVVNRTVFVNNVRVDGDKAVAEVRAGGITATESLVKSGDEWVLDSEASPFIRPEGGPAYGAPVENPGPQEFGSPVPFTSIPGIPPSAAVTLVAGEPIDPGKDHDGAGQIKGRIGNDFGKLGKVQTLRFINLPITLTNTGSKPFRGEVAGAAFDQSGHEFAPLNARDITQLAPPGRAPDWAEGEEKGIPPHASVTRYLTFAVPVGDRIVKWHVEPNVLSRPNTVTSMEPEDGATYRKAPAGNNPT